MVTRSFDKTVENFLLQRLEARVKYSMQKRQDRIKAWELAEDKALAYLHESDEDAIRRSAREMKGTTSYTTLQIPYTYATLMTAHTYMTSVFFSRSPVHQFAGRHGETEQQVSALEALVSYQVETGYHLVPYYIWLYDAGKYGCGVLGNYWSEEKVQYSSVQQMQVLGPDGAPVAGTEKKVQQTFRSAGYTGTRVYNVSPFDFGHDPHYPLYRFQEGEYCYVRKTIGWNEIKKRQYAGYYTKDGIARLPARPPHTAQVQEGSSALLRPDRVYQQTLGAANDDLKHPTSIDIFEVYVDLIQSEWQVGNSTFPEKWVFTISSDYGVLLGAEPLGNAHGKFPFSVIESEIEGYGLYGRGIPEVIDPIQRTMDWLINSHFYNVRASLNNQFIIDPSKIVIDDTEDGGPGFIYRLRPEAYGTDITKFFYQIPVTDITRTNMADLEAMQTIGERITGINEQMFGGISKSRTTATEVRTSTGFGVNRLKTITEYISAMGISTLASRIVLDSQQFYEGEKKFKIVGDLAQMAGPAFMQIDPEMLSGDYDFVPVDGTLPVDRMAMATLWQNIMGQMRNFPQLMAQFDIGKVFTHVAQLGGVRNINQFKVQVVPDAVLAQQMGAGNVVPIRTGGAGSPGPSFNSNVAQMPSTAGADLAGGENPESGAAAEIGAGAASPRTYP
jgi:hypothetical protein